MKEFDAQLCTLRELVMAHHAYERSLAEFAKSINMPLNADTRHLMQVECERLEPREVQHTDVIRVIANLNDM